MPRSKAFYKHKPIASVDALARALNLSVSDLKSIALRANNLYRLARVIKKEGKRDRHVYQALEPLAALQGRINKVLFREVEYPSYLMGGIPDPEKRRGYVRSAQLHAGSALLLGEDVSDFFPSVTESQVTAIFKHVFRFRQDVAALLAKLCVRNGRLVQGAAPSTYIANLAFYQDEPALYEYVTSKGMAYDRFIDDLSVSAKTTAAPSEVTHVVRLLRRMIERQGFVVNRKKQVIARRGQRRQVHNLNVDGPKVTLPLKERKKIRAAVHAVEMSVIERPGDKSLLREFQSVSGRVARLATLHPREGAALKTRLISLRNALPAR